MNIRATVLLGVISTLIAGILIGSLGTSALQARRAEQIREVRDRGGVARYLARALKTSQDSLDVELRATIEKAEMRFREVRRMCGDSLESVRLAMMDDLSNQLTPAQLERLEAGRERDRSRKSSGRKSKRSK